MFFFFKQKTADEMRISDWSSDVCSSDLVTHELANPIEVIGAIAIGAAIGLVMARKIAMTAMPQLVAAFHSLVGLAAVAVAAAAYLNPGAFGIADEAGQIFTVSRIEMGLGIAIGAITFSGSVIRSEEHTSELQSLMRIPYAV